MKIERIDDKTVKCFLSNEELEEYDIDYKDFVTRSDKAKEVVQEIFEEKKAEIGAAEKKAQAGENAGESGKKNKKAAEAQKPQFAIFAFRNIGRVIEYAAVLPTNLRIDSTLYRMEDGTCYAYVRKGGASYERYSRACIQAMEFAAR